MKFLGANPGPTKRLIVPREPSFRRRIGSQIIGPACRRLVVALVAASGLLLSALQETYATGDLRIESVILRNRVVVLDRVVMRKGLYVAFSMSPRSTRSGKLRIDGWLVHDSAIIAEASLTTAGERAGNLAFDLPYDIPEGEYSISIQATNDDGTVVARGLRSLERSVLRSDASEHPAAAIESLRELPPRTATDVDSVVTDAAKANGYVLFARSPLTYVYPGDVPRRDELTRELSARVARNATAMLSISLYATRDIGKIRIGVSDLESKHRMLSRGQVRVACVDSVPDTTGAPQGTFRLLPAKLRPVGPSRGAGANCRRFWITVRVDRDVAPGTYSGRLTISPERGANTTLPIRLKVEPITLEDVPGVDYCMLMTYEFTELAMPWSAEDREKIRQAAARVLADYRDHGMTTLCLHSPFVWMTRRGGEPALDDLEAALEDARNAGFTRPIVWYMGHLIQTAKPRHPGNIRGFEEKVDLNRLRALVRAGLDLARKERYPGIVFLPIDEPDDPYQDIDGRRLSIAPALLRAIKEAGGTSMVTGESYARLGRPDYLASSRLIPAERDRAHSAGARYWVYENRVTMECTSPSFARYQYGYFTWKHSLDGMSSWTFQNTQNAAGLPGNPNPPGPAGHDVYLAYPSPAGPIATIRWEAIRAGIEDRKLIYQLEKRIARARSLGRDVGDSESFLAGLRTETGEPCCDADSCQVDQARLFDERRDLIMTMTLRAQAVAR